MTLQERALGANYHSEIRKRRRTAGKKKSEQTAGREGGPAECGVPEAK